MTIMSLKEDLLMNQQGYLKEDISEMGPLDKRHNKSSRTHEFAPNLFLED